MSKWISVDEKLPDFDGHYLVKRAGDMFNSTGMSIDGFSSCVHPHFSSERISKVNVTHWMPLPEPPKQ